MPGPASCKLILCKRDKEREGKKDYIKKMIIYERNNWLHIVEDIANCTVLSSTHKLVLYFMCWFSSLKISAQLMKVWCVKTACFDLPNSKNEAENQCISLTSELVWYAMETDCRSVAWFFSLALLSLCLRILFLVSKWCLCFTLLRVDKMKRCKHNVLWPSV